MATKDEMRARRAEELAAELAALREKRAGDLTQSELAKLMRAIPSESRSAAARENGKKHTEGTPGRPETPLDRMRCTCGAGDSLVGHKSACPRGRAIRRRAPGPARG